MERPQPDAEPLQWALYYDQLGMNIVPAYWQQKNTAVKWQRFQTQRSSKSLRMWFPPKSRRNVWMVCGKISGLIVLDCDTEQAEQWWYDRIGDVMDATCCVKTAKGHHYWFRIPESVNALPSWSHHNPDTGLKWDVQGDGKGVLVPPSTHPDGPIYEFVRWPDELQEAPGQLLSPKAASVGTEGATTGTGRSMLAHLLAAPPSAEGSRNEWLTKVAGHWAKRFRHEQDAYELLVAEAAAKLSPPLEDVEISKILKSVWKTEHAKPPNPTKLEEDLQTSEPTEDSGWLVGHGNRIYCQTKDKEQGLELAAFADFDIRALGVVEDENAVRAYDVEITRARDGQSRRMVLHQNKLARTETIAAFFGEFGGSVAPPEGAWPRMAMGERIRRYLESQKPPLFEVVFSLGYHERAGGFVCHEGIIKPDGLHAFDGVKPDPRLRDWAAYNYGFESTEDEAVDVLRRVLTFHDETVCAVFGAWWAVCALKPQVMRTVSQFPFMAIEAPSESGKSTGFFPMMLALNGNMKGNDSATRASFRDALSGSQSGIVWIDDEDDPDHLFQLVRQATAGGSVTKKGQDRYTQETVRLVNPICFSGEALKLQDQKALMDRSVMIGEVPNPTGRRSVVDPDREQWEDVLGLLEQVGGYAGLCSFAGTLQMLLLRRQNMVAQIKKLRPSKGRWGDKIGIIRCGSRILADLIDDDWVVGRVDEWATTDEAVGLEDTLTRKLLPMALAAYMGTHHPEKPRPPHEPWATPAFVFKDVVWFSIPDLVWWWSHEVRRRGGGRVVERTETEAALKNQARNLGAMQEHRRKRYNLGRDRTTKRWYWSLDAELSALVVARSEGKRETVVQKAGLSAPKQQRFVLPASVSPEWLDSDET